MSYYEDLGVGRGATAEEIREQYRTLVRLFHPDQFADPTLKAAAEGQMRRLNEIEAVLTDPDRRRAYDLGAGKPIVIQAPPHPGRHIPWNSLAWGAAAMACAGAIVWVSDHETPLAPAPVAAHATVGMGGIEEDWRSRVRAALAERDQALRELSRLRAEMGQPRTGPSSPAPAAADPAEMAPRGAPTALAKPVLEPSSALKRFAGIWVYERRLGVGVKLNAPEFIETQITEIDGQMRGRYRSRYRVTDRAISPSVNFEFSGQAGGTSAEMPIVRDDGARGEVRLRLLSERELELVWTATGSPFPSLTSGTAILVRGQ